MVTVEEGRKGCFGPIVELSRCVFAGGVLCRRDDFKILAFEFFVNLLPAWQILRAPSPGSPGEKQDFLPPEIRKAHGLAFSVGQGKVRCDRRIKETTA